MQCEKPHIIEDLAALRGFQDRWLLMATSEPARTPLELHLVAASEPARTPFERKTLFLNVAQNQASWVVGVTDTEVRGIPPHETSRRTRFVLETFGSDALAQAVAKYNEL